MSKTTLFLESRLRETDHVDDAHATVTHIDILSHGYIVLS
jgi:hypothetical protein